MTLRFADVMTFVEGIHGSADNDDAYADQARAWLGVRPYRFTAVQRTLTDVLVAARAPQTLGFMSLDLEGAESQALRGLDFDQFRPRVLMVEAMAGVADLEKITAAIPTGYDDPILVSHHDYVMVDGRA